MIVSGFALSSVPKSAEWNMLMLLIDPLLLVGVVPMPCISGVMLVTVYASALVARNEPTNPPKYPEASRPVVWAETVHVIVSPTFACVASTLKKKVMLAPDAAEPPTASPAIAVKVALRMPECITAHLLSRKEPGPGRPATPGRRNCATFPR